MKVMSTFKYQSEDNQLFDSAQECAEHEAKEAIRALFHLSSSSRSSTSGVDLVDPLFENREELTKIFSNYSKAIFATRRHGSASDPFEVERNKAENEAQAKLKLKGWKDQGG